MKIIFFPNGNTAAFENGMQVPILQESWFMLYVHMIAAIGVDPTEVEFTMPDTSKVRVTEREGRLIFGTEGGK